MTSGHYQLTNENSQKLLTSGAGNAINFMIVHPDSVIKVMKHRLARVFTPAQNPTADGYLVNYRYSAGVFVPDNKVKGIYMHRASTANS